MAIAACFARFKRDKKGEWEKGIAITREIGSYAVIIYDKDMKLIEEIWDYNLEPFFGAFTLGDVV